MTIFNRFDAPSKISVLLPSEIIILSKWCVTADAIFLFYRIHIEAVTHPTNTNFSST